MESNVLVKGVKTSELWVVIIILVPWVLQQFGIDLGSAIQSSEDLKAAITAAHNNSPDLPIWVAMLYVFGRKALKWKSLG